MGVFIIHPSLGYVKPPPRILPSRRSLFFEHQVDNQLVVTPYPALLYPITEALPPRHAAVNRSAAPSHRSLPLRRGVGSSLAAAENDQVCAAVLCFRVYTLLFPTPLCLEFLSLHVLSAILNPPTMNNNFVKNMLQQKEPPSFSSFYDCLPLMSRSSRAASCCVVAPGLQTCIEAILHRDLGYAWVNFIRLASVRLAPLDVNIDMALVDALLEVSARVMDLMEVRGRVDTQ